MVETFVVCSKCGKTAEYGQAQYTGWLIQQQINAPQGHLIIRCPDCITTYARRQAGLPRSKLYLHANPVRQK